MNPPTNTSPAESAAALLSRFVAPKSTRLSRRDRVRQGLLIALAAMLVISLLWAANLFVSFRLSLRRIYFVPGATSGKIALVALDDASLNAYGRSPTQWSRSVYADLLDKLGGARTVVFDLLFVEPDTADQQFADAIQQVHAQHTSVVLAAAGVGSVQTVTTADGLTALSYPTVLRPIKPLADAATYLAFTNSFADTDGMIRRQPSLFQTPNGDLGLSLSLTAYLAYLRIPLAAAPQVLSTANGVLDVTPQRQLYVDQDGLWLQNYFGTPGSSFPIYSLKDVVDGQVDAAKFQDKVVFVGLMNNLGAVDTYPVPSSAHGEQMPGVEIQAHALESILQNSALREQPIPAQAALVVVLALLASSTYAQVRWYWKLAIGAALLVLLLIAASFYFSLTHTIIDLFYTGLALMLPMLISIGLDITTEISRRQRTEFLLESMVAVANEQMAIDKMLPRIAADLRRTLDIDSGAIWFNETGSDAPVIHSFMPDSAVQLQPLYQTLVHNPQTVVEADRLAVPIMWQKRLVGVIALKLKHHRPRPISRATQYLVEDIAEQIAPSLENARLFEQIQREVKLREAILLGAPTGIAIISHAYEVVTANAVFRGIWDMESSDFLDLLSAAEVEDKSIKRLCDHLMQPGDFAMQLKIDARTFSLNATLLPTYNLWVMTFSDVTALADLNALKSHLIRMASHDLKNPLSVVLAYAELIQMSDDEVPQETLEYVDRIRRSGQIMLNIIEDILKLEQLRSTELPRERMVFTATVTEVIERHKPEMILKHQTFEAQIAADLPPINGNPGQLSQVVTNLLGNAVKYTPDGGHITVRLYQLNEQAIRLEVRDTGYGIPKAQQTKLFTEFYRVKTQATADIPGTGLGLSLVKSVVEVHEGKIWVESEENQGSTFFVELPIATQEPEPENEV